VTIDWTTMRPADFDRDASAGEQLALEIPVPDEYGTQDMLDEPTVARRPILCRADGTDLSDRTRWYDPQYGDFCTLAELQAYVDGDEHDEDQEQES
jgi:hypothetical protein